MNTKKVVQLTGALAMLAAVVVALVVLPVEDYLAGFLERVESAGPWGPVLLTSQTAFFVAGLVMTVVATVVITRVATRARNEAA